jgi:hypothetical protein
LLTRLNTPQELERKKEIALLRQKALKIYELALELLERASIAAKGGKLVEYNHWLASNSR